MSSESKLPDYKQPPVDEVVCGIRFEPLTQLRVPHIGVLWSRFREEYPKTQHAPPIPTETTLLVDDATGVPLPRVWFISEADSELIQFQLDRFYYNWRHRGEEYPRYTAIIQKFEKAKKELDAFTQELKLGPLNTVEFELTYINNIRKEPSWENVNDLSKVLIDLPWQNEKHSFLPIPTNAAWQLRFSLPNERGSLSVKFNEVKRRADGAPLLRLELNAKSSRNEINFRDWFDLAHEWIVCGFADLTTSEAQDMMWKRER